MQCPDVVMSDAAPSRVLLLAALSAMLVRRTRRRMRAEGETVLRVCADPEQPAAVRSRGAGYENKIAEELARDLGRSVEYTYFPQRMGFVRNTLRRRTTRRSSSSAT